MPTLRLVLQCRRKEDGNDGGGSGNGDNIMISHRAREAMHSSSQPALKCWRDDRWFQKFDLLQKYMAEHDGSCDVPQKHAELGVWVNKQRNEKKFLDEGKLSQLTKERVLLLESMGFKWSEPRGQASWEKRFRELVEYKNKTGHCNFPTKPKEKELSALGRWVTTQRNDKKNGRIDKENEAKLNSIGFRWDRINTEFLVK